MHTFIWGPAKLRLILRIWLTVAGKHWGGGENFNFLHQMASLRKSPFQHDHILKMKNQPFEALIRRKIDGLLSSQDTGGLKIKSGGHHTAHYVLRCCPFFGLGSFYFSQKNGREKSNSLCNKPPILYSKSFQWLNSSKGEEIYFNSLSLNMQLEVTAYLKTSSNNR